MKDLTLLLLNAGLTAFGFFVAAPILLNAISTFGVQKRFAQAMIQEGIIEPHHVRELQPKKQLAGVIIAAIVLGAAYFTASRINFGLICLTFGFLVGLVRYRKVLQFNSLTVKRFQSTYRDLYDAGKMNRYVDKMF
ncbi:MAG: hypothetical protein E7426_04065 [Ruminococcaceae bacterium]|jgi:hypothetical protein|nr:hypothetical protein [Oscillospiraceae bacterium]